MANNVVINAQYNPFSYEEMINPIMLADNAYKAQEQAIANLSAEASLVGSLANNEKDYQSYLKYRQWQTDLDEKALDLAQNGYNPRSRQAFNQMRTRYAGEIVPIKTAYDRRNQLAEEQRKARLQDSTMLFDFNAEDLSLSDYINNPHLQYQNYSGADLEKLSTNVASTLAKELRDPQSNWRGILNDTFGPQYFEREIAQGLSPEQVVATILRDPRGSGILRGMLDSVIEGSGIKGWNNQDALRRAEEHVNRGAFAAIGGEKLDRVNNQMFDVKSKAYLDDRARAARGNGQPEENGEIYLSPSITLGLNFNKDQEKQMKEKESSFKGIKQDTSGAIINDNLTFINEDIAKREKEISDFLKTHPKANIEPQNYGSANQRATGYGRGIYGALGNTMNQNTDTSGTGYQEYKRMKSELDELKGKRQKEQDTISKYAKEYEYLGGSTIDNIQKGMALEQSQLRRANRVSLIRFEGEEQNNMINGIRDAFRVKANRSTEDFGLRKVKEDGTLGEKLSRKETLAILGLNKDGTNVSKWTSDGYNIMMSTSNGMEISTPKGEYQIAGLDDIDDFNNKTMQANEYLGDYSKKGMESATIINQSDLNGLDNQTMLQAIVENGDKINDTTVGISIQKDNGDIEKVVVNFSDPRNPMVMTSSLYDEIGNSGNTRERSLRGYTNNEVPYFKNMFEGNRNRSATIPTANERIYAGYAE